MCFKNMSEHVYLDVSLQLTAGPSEEISGVYFKNHISQCMKTLFGQVGTSTVVDVLKYDLSSQRGILRCSSSAYVKLRTSLLLSDNYQNISGVYKIHKVSSCLSSLLGDSRSYNHTKVVN